MAAYRAPDFNERTALSRQSKQKALDKLRAVPVASEAELAERRATRLKREEAEAEKRAIRDAEKRAASEALAIAAEAAARAREAAIVPQKSEADRKVDRDARYAARKNRKK
jgi:Family of unknown function (DUF6481)